MKVATLILVILMGAGELCAQESFQLPRNMPDGPVAYLEKMNVRSTSLQLNQAEKHNLCRLFTRAYVVAVRKHGQDYLLKTSAPIYQLLLTNFPDISTRQTEGGSAIFLAAIVKFFNASPDYRNDVVQVLKEGVGRQHCRNGKQ